MTAASAVSRDGRLAAALGRVGHAVVFAAAAAVLVFGVIALDRGFDLTDESYYLLVAIHPSAVTLYVSAQHWVTGPLWDVAGSLAAFRAWGLGILVGSAALLAAGVHAVAGRDPARPPRAGVWTTVAASVVGALLYIATINVSPCYNLLASAGAYAATGFTLLSLRTMGRRRLAALALAGAMLCVTFVDKPSSGVAVFGLLAFGMLILTPTRRDGLACVVVVAATTALCTVALALSQSTPAAIRTGLTSGLELFRMVQTEPVGARLVRYVVDFAVYAGEAFRAFWPAILLVVVYRVTRWRLALAAGLAVLLYTLMEGRYALGGADQYGRQTEAAFVLLLLALGTTVPLWLGDGRRATLLLGLAALPYAVAAGTGNALFTQVIDAMAPWGVVIAVLAGLDHARPADRILAQSLLAIFAGLLASQIVTSGFREPYHLATPLVGQRKRVDVGDLGRVRVDPATAAFVTALDTAAADCYIQPGTPILGLYNIPGVALALRLVPPVSPWLNNAEQVATVIRFGEPDLLRRTVVAVVGNTDARPVAMPPALVAFPTGFTFCGAATDPVQNQRIALWRASQR